MKVKRSSVNLEAVTNTELSKVSILRRESGLVAWRKKDIIAELVAKEYKRNFKQC